jgi:hypothetical protein
VFWQPPGIALAKKALSDKKKYLGVGISKTLCDAWSQRHIGIKTIDVKNPAADADTVSECHQAEFCICSPEREELRTLVHATQRILGNTREYMLVPKSAGRVLYDAGMATSARSIL